MSFLDTLFKRTRHAKVDAGLQQADRELFDAHIAKHNAERAIEYWESRITLLHRLSGDKAKLGDSATASE